MGSKTRSAAEVHFSRILRAQATATDPVTAADRVVEKLRHRVERLRGRLHRQRVAHRHGSVHFGAPRKEGTRHPDVAGDASAAGRDARTEAMTPEEAALEMALLSYDFYLFVNTETAQRAVVYRRVDGDVGLVAAATSGLDAEA